MKIVVPAPTPNPPQPVVITPPPPLTPSSSDPLISVTLKNGVKIFVKRGKNDWHKLKWIVRWVKVLVVVKNVVGMEKIKEKKSNLINNQVHILNKKKKCVNGNNKGGGDNGVCGTVTTSTTAAEFLEKLGPCSKTNNDNGEEHKIDFNDKEKTFGHETYCDPCSEFKIKCKGNGDCKGGTNDKCKNNKISADAIRNGRNSTKILDMLVSDNVENVFEHVLDECVLGDCKSSGIFKGFRKEQWKCGKVCGYVVCKSENGNGRENQNKIITIRGLVEHWVHNFLEDYNKIRKKLNLCVKNRKDPKCIKYCVDTWINEKRKEWQQITERLNEQYKNDNQPDYSVKTILEELIPKIAVVNDQDNVIKLSVFENSKGCSANANEQNKNGYQDAIDCMLKKLKDKIGECKKKHDENSGQSCTQTTSKTPSLDDEEEEYEYENDKKVDPPKICPQQETPAETVEDKDACKTDAPQTDVKKEEEEKEETKVIPESEDSVDSKPEELPPPATPPSVNPTLPADEPFNRDLLEKTIPFGIALALGSIAFLFLKDVPNDYSSGDIPFNTQPNTLYFDKPEEKPFITSIHDRNLYSGEEYSYNVNMVNSMNDITINRDNNVYSGIDLINDTLSGNEHIDIYDEVLKRKENELFGTNHVKQTSIHSVAKPTNNDPIHNQLELFHKWLDRHRDMCEMWKNNHERLPKLKELWENETHSGDINSGIPSGNHVLNTDVSIQIHMDNPKTTNEFTYVDSNPNVTLPSNPNLVENQNPNLNLVENNINPNHQNQNQNQVGDTNFVDTPTNPTNVQIEMSVKNHKLVKEKYPIADVWDI
ncbi:hypothetical protein PFUGPA_02145 [Plasmodium falciparum Palo Alto/Uganda]|uniref:Erythrocyte membrane protein 1, PfEMP1 n=1 Tax=Plasmodium falciparum (isolate Palo Alto / Uganda) TaxID=57270 RepID=W4J0S0_PLAFP|nr:hypothetical protein PFUGPA_02145 [Plasmodium falciparum Palo Alto/Uganda]